MKALVLSQYDGPLELATLDRPQQYEDKSGGILARPAVRPCDGFAMSPVAFRLASGATERRKTGRGIHRRGSRN